MLARTFNLFFCTFVAAVKAADYSDSHSVTGPDPEITVYRLRNNIPGLFLQDDQAAKIAANLEEIIMEHDYGREFLKNIKKNGFQNKIAAEPYYVKPQKDPCLVNNGNCSQICESVGFHTVCSCRDGYTLTSATDCSPVTGCDVVLSGTSGEITIDKSNCQWLIKAPPNNIIEMTLHGMNNYYINGHRQFASIYDGNSTGSKLITIIDSSTTRTVFRSSGENVLIKSSEAYYYQPQRVSYVTGTQCFKLEGTTVGTLVVPISSLSEGDDCLSLIYNTPEDGSLTVSVNTKHGLQEITPEFTFMGHNEKWKRAIFRIPFHQEAETLNFEFHGEGTQVYNLGKCLNLEYIALHRQQSFGPDTLCRNGGVWSSTTESCTCPPGFVGTYCEDGCGPNRYGRNCSKLCSFLSTACEGMIFCSKESCSCAPGFQGVTCDIPCDEGYYGASCWQKCGNCRRRPCNRYTGVCYSGCTAGFYPPLCQQSYQVVVNPPDIVAVTYNSLKIRISFENVTGVDEPIFYQVQYKKEEENYWSKVSPRIIPSETVHGFMAETEIVGLLPGTVYETQVILIDNMGRSYQTDVPQSKARTQCIDPVDGEYKFTATDVGATSILVEWSYVHNKTSLICEIVEFEISLHCGSEEIKFVITYWEGSKILSDIMPDMTYTIKMVGKTVTGKKTLPVETTVHTQPAAPGIVRAVKVQPMESGRQLTVSWLPPWSSQSKPLRYRIRYQCDYLVACAGILSEASSGDTELSATSATLDHLQPHAVYRIAIASVSHGGLESEWYVTYGVTKPTAPQVAPSLPATPILAVTNTSALVSWLPPADCVALNGYHYGYTYSLVDNTTEEIIQQGTVPEYVRHVNFSGLSPSHCYEAHITVVTSGGTSASDQLIIPFCTTSTAPDRVQSLSVYKRGRRMVGLRWSAPLNTYGDIESFTVTYTIEGGGHTRKIVTEPNPCGAWRHLYCYTVSGLKPQKKYHFQVQARNKEVNIDGEPTSVEAITGEGASSPPVNLRIVNATESSMLVQWGLPDNINGQLRSFIIITEQIDTQGTSAECCDDIPLQDYRVESEEPFYQYEITGLSAAKTYSVAVSAKTVTLGDEARVIGYTYPPKASLPQNALTVVKAESDSYNSDVVTLQVQPLERISGVNRTYILLYLTNDSATQQTFDDDELVTLLKSRLTENYHLLSEYTQEEVENQPVVTFHLTELGYASTEFELQKYALILIQDYMGNRRMDIFITEEAEV